MDRAEWNTLNATQSVQWQMLLCIGNALLMSARDDFQFEMSDCSWHACSEQISNMSRENQFASKMKLDVFFHSAEYFMLKFWLKLKCLAKYQH